MGAGDVSGGTCSHGVWYLWRALVFVWDSPLWVWGSISIVHKFLAGVGGDGGISFCGGMGTSL